MTSNDFSQIYVACALTNVNESSRRILQRDCAAIVDTTQTVAGDQPWRVVAYDPITHTPPWAPPSEALSPEEVWRIDTTKVLEVADAIIIHGFQGGSTGVGIELALAFARGIPVLYIHHDTCAVTKMVTGMPGFVEIREFFDHGEDNCDELRRIVKEWLLKWRSVIDDGPSNRIALMDLFSPTQYVLHSNWLSLDAESKARAAFSARMTTAEADEFLSSPIRLSSLPSVKLLLLGAALGESVPHLLAPQWRPPPLSEDELEALRMAEVEYELGADFRKTLENVARVHKEMTKREPAVARDSAHYNFANPSDWIRFLEDWQHGHIG